jgi:hypothetical protein
VPWSRESEHKNLLRLARSSNWLLICETNRGEVAERLNATVC